MGGRDRLGGSCGRAREIEGSVPALGVCALRYPLESGLLPRADGDVDVGICEGASRVTQYGLWGLINVTVGWQTVILSQDDVAGQVASEVSLSMEGARR